MRGVAPCAFLLLLLALPPLRAEQVPATGSHYGGMGLLETRNARMRPDATLEAGIAWRRQRQFYFLHFQALPFLETTFRYTERLNGTTGSGSTSDRAFDLKLRLLEESDWLPAFAVGFQDLIGTGIYGGEYLVASKRFGAFDVSLGLGWGRLGTAGDFRNPLGRIDSSFYDRPQGVGEGGVVRARNFFRGEEVGVFGGVEWSLPEIAGIAGLRAKVELNGDGLRDERRDGRGKARSRINAGLAWMPVEGVDAGIAFVNGTDLMMRLSLSLNAAHPPASPLAEAPPPMPPRPLRVAAAPDGVTVPPGLRVAVPAGASLPMAMPPHAAGADAQAIAAALRAAGLRPLSVAVEGGAAEVAVADGRFRTMAQVTGRVARAVQGLLPAEVELLRVAWWRGGAEIARVAVPRRALEQLFAGDASIEEVWPQMMPEPATGARRGQDVARWPGIEWFVAPRLDTQLMDPNDPFRFDVKAAGGVRAHLPRGLSVGGVLTQTLFGNIGDAPPSDSQLPHVRSDVGRYAEEGTTAIASLTVEGIWNVAPDVFARVTLGYLEPMYAGLSAEMLWRPHGAWWALGADLNAVRQRDFDQTFGLRDYGTVTGLVSFHADLPWWDLYAVVRAGRYLARDWGATLELGRRFDSGIEVGGFATFTNVSYSQFGEGSFDKGIYVRFPFDLFGPTSRARGALTVRPIQRDGGQPLVVENPLAEVTREGRDDLLGRGMDAMAR